MPDSFVQSLLGIHPKNITTMQKMKHLQLLAFVLLLPFVSANAQYTATDFTLTDMNGDQHHLFGYLDEGKTVVLEFFAPWCGPCVDILETGALQEVYLERGPGTVPDDVMIISIESDPNTGNYGGLDELLEFGEVPYPVVDMYPSDFAAMSGYDEFLQGWPFVLAICPNRSMRMIGVEDKEQVLREVIIPKVYAGEDGEINCYRTTLQSFVSDTDKDYISFSWTKMLPNGSATSPPFPYNELNPEVTETGVFLLGAQNNWTGCGRMDTVTITDVDLDPPLLFFTEDTLYLSCLTDTIDIFSNGLWGGGVWERSWETTNGHIAEIVDETAHHIIAVGAGTYSTTTFDSLNGCSATVSVVVSDAPPIELLSFSLENTSPGQTDGAISLEATGGTGGLSYLWDNGLATPAITDLSVGNYTCTISDENGCELIAGPYEILDSPSAIFETEKYGLLKIYPNPSEGLVYITLPSHSFTDGFLSVFDLYGKLFFSETWVGNKSERAVDLSGMTPGIYQMVFQNGLERAHGRIILF